MDSAWWNSDEQVAKRNTDTERLISLQAQAKAARARAKAGHPSNYRIQP